MRSAMTTSTGSRLSASSACWPSAASMTSYPSMRRLMERLRRWLPSSSTMRMRWAMVSSGSTHFQSNGHAGLSVGTWLAENLEVSWGATEENGVYLLRVVVAVENLDPISEPEVRPATKLRLAVT